MEEAKMEKQQVSTHRGGHLEALLNGCPDAILAIDAEGIIKFANKKACELTERDMTELIGESIVIVYEDLEAAREANRKIYEGGGTLHNYESKLRTKSGKLIPVRMSASHLKDYTGKYIGGVGYFAPYRPWGKAETEVKTRLEELEARMERWKGMAAPVFELYPGLSFMVVVGHVDASRFEDIAGNLLSHIESTKPRVVLIDLTAAGVDDEVASQLTKVIRTVCLLGARFIIAGMQLGLAQALEPLMADLECIRACSSRELALQEALNMIGYQICKKG
jgi:PAS domain S-box-containing protein